MECFSLLPLCLVDKRPFHGLFMAIELGYSDNVDVILIAIFFNGINGLPYFVDFRTHLGKTSA